MEGDKKTILYENVEDLEGKQPENTFVPISGWQDSIFAQLSDMFGEVISSDVIRNTCLTCDWRVEECIEKLIEIREKNDKENLINLDSNGKSSNEFSLPNEDKPKKYLGAIPKSTNTASSDNNTDQTCVQPKPFSFSNILLQGSSNFVDMHQNSAFTQKINQHPAHKELVERIVEKVNAGYKVLVLMRGAPGSGKSHLAHEIIDRTVKGDYRNHIFSTDDFFCNVNNQYIYQPDRLEEAHSYNQKCVRKWAANGWSPIIVDNTNMKVWEMIPYVGVAVRNGYLIDILEPKNDWCRSAGKLASKNCHGVPKDKIERMLSNYEPISVDDLLKISNEVYTVTVPQLRHNPPLPYTPTTMADTVWGFFKDYLDNTASNEACASSAEASNTTNNEPTLQNSEEEANQNYDEATLRAEWISYNDAVQKRDQRQHNKPNGPKPRRETKRNRNANFNEENLEVSSDSDYIINQVEDEWKAYEEESNEFWSRRGEESASNEKSAHKPKPQRKNVKSPEKDDNKILSILKNEVREFAIVQDESTSAKVERHTVGCENESKSFALLRQIYPNKPIDSLWDLYEKCDGNINWAIEILLKDESDEEASEKSCITSPTFECNCGKEVPVVAPEMVQTDEKETPNAESDQLKPSKTKSKKEKMPLSEEMLEAKRTIENQFVLGDEHYSSHVKKIRDLRHGVVSDTSANVELADADTSSSLADEVFKEDEPTVQDVLDVTLCEEINEDDASSDGENEEMMEISLGKDLIQQLESEFGDNTMKYNIDDFKTNIFMPKSLGKQLYALWMESFYNQMEEQKMKTIKEDEEFARLLIAQQNLPKFIEPPNNLNEALDMELAWNIYKSENENWKNSLPNDLASHLSRLKLCEIFPNVEKETLIEVLAANEHKFAETVDFLKGPSDNNVDDAVKKKTMELFEKAKNEIEKESANKSTTQVDGPKSSELANNNLRSSVEKKLITPEDEKRAALKAFEDSRNMATHHSQLKAECYQKAKDAIQKGNTAVAVYYSQIASLHKTKIDMYNQKAANSIMEVNDLTQTNPDFIDLHYLHVNEAVQCLDIFIDKHITKMRNTKRSYKHIFIITGRGLHSARGVSAIKNRVKLRLKDRSLKWSEVNPGLLKVKLFSTSRYARSY